MSTAPIFCPHCAALNIVATVNGPTRQHTRGSGDWWPAGWASMPEPQRLAWLTAKAKSK